MTGRVGSDQGCCKHPANAQDTSPQERVIYSQKRTVLRLRSIAVNDHPIHLSYIDDIVFTCLLLLLLLSRFSHVQLCDPVDSSPPGSALPGILQAITLEWVAVSFSSLLVHFAPNRRVFCHLIEHLK